MRTRHWKAAFTASLCMTVLFLACRKNFGDTFSESNSSLREAKLHLTSIVESENSLLAMPFSQLQRNSNMRRFARIAKLSEAAQWNKAKTFQKNAAQYTLVPVEDDVHHLHNPGLESVRFLIFSRKGNEKLQMEIIELYGKTNVPLETDVMSAIQTAAENRLFNESKSISHLSGSVIFYDRYYYNKASFQLSGGNWKKARIVIENTSKKLNSNAIKANGVGINNSRDLIKQSLTTLSPMVGCSPGGGICTTYYLVGIWYDSDGMIVDSEILDSWDVCIDPDYIPQGNAPGTTVISDDSNNSSSSNNRSIYNNLTDPCLSALLSAKTSAIANFAGLALSNESITKPINMYFRERSNMPSNLSGGMYDFYEDASGAINILMELNPNTLPTYSNEYTFSIVLHEVLHGILLSKGIPWENVAQHDEIANYYRNLISGILQEQFPTLSTQDADALSWEGLAESSAWTALGNGQNAIIAILDKYKNPSSNPQGTRCP